MSVLNILDALDALGVLRVLVLGHTWLPVGVGLEEAFLGTSERDCPAAILTLALSFGGWSIAVEASIRVGDWKLCDALLDSIA
jgi:hypothetical protein